MRTQSRVVVHGPLAFVELTRGLWACIDAEDVPLVEGRCWNAEVRPTGTMYAATNANRRTLRMHQMLVQACIDIDHRNGQGLDNRRSNLRLATRAENMGNVGLRTTNRSGFKGVHWNKECRRWQATIMHHGVSRYLGLYDTPQEAHDAYTTAALELRGDFARTS